MNVEWHQAAADPQTKPNDLGYEFARRLPESTPTMLLVRVASLTLQVECITDRA